MDRRRMCVMCRTHPIDPRWRPFCSQRCQTEDQARWAGESYRVAGPAATPPLSDDDRDDHDDG